RSAAAPAPGWLVEAVPALHGHTGLPRRALRGIRTPVTAAHRELVRRTLTPVRRPAHARGRAAGVVPSPADGIGCAVGRAFARNPAPGLGATGDAAVATRVVGVVTSSSAARGRRGRW